MDKYLYYVHASTKNSTNGILVVDDAGEEEAKGEIDDGAAACDADAAASGWLFIPSIFPRLLFGCLRMMWQWSTMMVRYFYPPVHCLTTKKHWSQTPTIVLQQGESSLMTSYSMMQ